MGLYKIDTFSFNCFNIKRRFDKAREVINAKSKAKKVKEMDPNNII